MQEPENTQPNYSNPENFEPQGQGVPNPEPSESAQNQDIPSSNPGESAQNQDFQNPDQSNQTYFPDFERPIQEELVFQWQAPSRAFKKRNRQYFTTIATIVLLLCLILFFAGQILPVAVVIAVAFLSYIMATIPPHTITNSITTFGIHNENNLYYWEEMGRFWFEKKYDDLILFIEVDRFPFRLSLLLGNESQEELTEILSEVLINERPPLTETERFAQWLQKKVPLDLDS
jgi:hypothetical protein